MLNQTDKTKDIAMMAIMAAVYVVISILPGIPVAPGVSIEFEAGFAVVIGVFLGPFLGFLTAFLGSLISWFILGSGIFGLPFLFNPPLNALLVGLIIYKKEKISVMFGILGVYTILIIIQLVSPPLTPLIENGYVAIAVIWDKIIGLALVIPTVLIYNKFKFNLKNNSILNSSLIISFFLIALVGNIFDNLLGTVIFSYPFIYQGIYGFTLEAVRISFLTFPFIYLPIRIAQSIFATLIIIGLVKIIGTETRLSENLISKNKNNNL